jgi:hypothetical protein
MVPQRLQACSRFLLLASIPGVVTLRIFGFRSGPAEAVALE